MSLGLQGNPTGPLWRVLVSDPNLYHAETAQEYIRNAIYNKWETNTWAIPGCENTGIQRAVGADVKVQRPTFKVCHIKDGRLSVAPSVLEVHACGSVTTLARLNAQVKESDKIMHVPEYTIGTGTKEKPAKKPKVIHTPVTEVDVEQIALVPHPPT